MSNDDTIDDERLRNLLWIAGDSIEVPDDGTAGIVETAFVRGLVETLPSEDGDDVGIEIADDTRALHSVGGRRGVMRPESGRRAQRRSLWLAAAACVGVIGVGGVAWRAVGTTETQVTQQSVSQPRQAQANSSSASRARVDNLKTTNTKVFVTDASGRTLSLARGSNTTSFGIADQNLQAYKATTTPDKIGDAIVDRPKLEKDGAIELELRRATLTARYDDVQQIAKANGGYLASGKTDEVGDAPRATATVRIPVSKFDATLAAVAALGSPKLGNKVVGRTATSLDVTAQFSDLNAELKAATSERDQVSLVLSKATSIGDILAVRDRLNTVQTEIDRLQGQVNVINDQTSYASIAVTLHETTPAGVGAEVAPKPQTGLAKAWADARLGFGHSIEWIVARSGKGIVALLAILGALFALRYLYPTIKRALL